MKPAPAIKDYGKPLGPYSHAVVANGFVFVSGQTGLKPGGAPGEYAGPTVQDQTRQALRNIETILKDLGLALADVVRATVYLANPADVKATNAADRAPGSLPTPADYKAMKGGYKEFFPEDPPARPVARLGAEVPGLLVTIDAIAVYAPHAEEGGQKDIRARGFVVRT